MARASVVHDRLRRSKCLGDLIFLKAMGVERVPLPWRLLTFAAVLINFSR